MTVIYYTNAEMKRVNALEVSSILGTEYPEEMTDETREQIRRDEIRTMCNVITAEQDVSKRKFISIPWQWIVEITY